MKHLFIFFIAVAVVACNNDDKKTQSESLSQSEKQTAAKDSSNFTSIEWLDSTTKNLGDVKKGELLEISYRFKNSGDKNLIIADVAPGCGCTVAQKPEKPIPPGGEDVIKAQFDSKNQHAGEHTKYVNVTANTKPEQLTSLKFRVNVTE